MEPSTPVWYRLCVMLVVAVTMSFIDLSTSEPNYEIGFINMENYMDETAPIKVIDGQMVRYNRSIIVSNVSVDLKEDLCEDAMCSVNGYEKASAGKYVSGSLNLGPLLCKELTDNVIYHSLLPFSNLPKGFPLKKSIYNIVNYLLRSEMLPDTIPGSENWKFEITIRCGDKLMYHVGVFLKFDRSEWQKKQAAEASSPKQPGR